VSATRDSAYPVATTSAADGTAPLVWAGFTTAGGSRNLIAILMGNGAGTTAILTLTSPSLTWTLRVATVDAGNNNRVEIWTAFAVGALTGEVVTSTHVTSGCSYGRRSALIFSIAGSDINGVGNVASNNAGGGGTPTLDVVASGAGSYLMAGFPYRSSGGDITVDGNTASEYDAGGGGGFGFNERAGSRSSAAAGAVTLGWSGTPFSWESIAGIEIKDAAPVIPLVVDRPLRDLRPFPFLPGSPQQRF
jgi:hypothetical protein